MYCRRGLFDGNYYHDFSLRVRKANIIFIKHIEGKLEDFVRKIKKDI